MRMHGADVDLSSSLVLKLAAGGISVAAQRDLVAYWDRRRLEGRPNDLT